MKIYRKNRKENTMTKQVKQILEQDASLKLALRQAGVEIEHLWDPEFAHYLMDAPYAKSGKEPEQILKTHLAVCEETSGTLRTQTTEEWERYPLEAMIRLLWRMRETNGEVLFMRGDAGKSSPPILWKAELSWEQGSRVLNCYDEEHRCRLYMVLSCPDYILTRSKFFADVQDFLDFPEGTVWICSHTKRKIMEVI